MKTLACDGETATVSFQIGADQTQCKQLLRAVAASCDKLTVGALQGCVTETYAQQTCSRTTVASSCGPFFACIAGDGSAS